MALHQPLSSLNWVVYQLDAASPVVSGEPFNEDTLKQIALDSWEQAPVPGTVSNILKTHEELARADDYVWCYCANFEVNKDLNNQNLLLKCEGLATHCDVWVNDSCVLHADSMYINYDIDISKNILKKNTISLVFHSLSSIVNRRLAKPKWKTQLVKHQQLRWLRTTLLGRIPGWANAQSPIGPWKNITLIDTTEVYVKKCNVTPSLDTKKNGIVRLRAEVYTKADSTNINIALRIKDADESIICVENIATANCLGTIQIDKTLNVAKPQLWWPHTHGNPYLYSFELVDMTNGEEKIVKTVSFGFKTVGLSHTENELQFNINDTSIFCRGGCWTSVGFGLNETSSDSTQKVKRILEHAKTAGVNMIRVGGTMIYEHDAFYQQCSALGILVWQDCMFANMDYPFDDDAFLKKVKCEMEQNIARITQHVSSLVICGSSEVAQQAAMVGQPQSVWKNDFYENTLSEWVDEFSLSDVIYFPTSPYKGSLPFQTNVGLAHYFGVGAYRQPINSLFRDDVKFASECLAFSNVPDEETRKKYFGTPYPAPHTPQWKAGICRDNAAGWDFSDITDFYIEKMFDLKVSELKYCDIEHYYRLQEVVVGEIISQTYNYWRSSKSKCSGGLIWYLNDLVPGAGWGLFDSDGNAKPVLHATSQSWQPLQVILINEELNGHYVEVINERNVHFDGELTIQLLSRSGELVHSLCHPISIDKHSYEGWQIDELLDQFFDTSHSYKFGPKKIAAVGAAITLAGGKTVLSSAVNFVGDATLKESLLDINIKKEQTETGAVVYMQSDTFIQNIKIDYKNCSGYKNNFHMLPNMDYRLNVDCDIDMQARAKLIFEHLNGGGAQRLPLAFV